MAIPIPGWMMTLVRDWLFNKATAALAAEIVKDDPAIVPTLKAYDAGASFMDIVKIYVNATNNKGDLAVAAAIEEFRADLETKPFNEVLPQLAATIAALPIPDGDGDPTNDITVGVAFGRIKDKIVE